MNICYVVHNVPRVEKTGAPIIADRYIAQALKRGFTVTLLVPERTSAYYHDSNVAGFEMAVWPSIQDWSIVNYSTYPNDFEKADVKINKPDIIHIIDLVHFLPSILNFLKEFNAPIIRHICSAEDICPKFTPIYHHPRYEKCTKDDVHHSCAKCLCESEHVRIQEGNYSLKQIEDFLLDVKTQFLEKYNSALVNKRTVLSYIYSNIYDHLIFPSKSFSEYYFEILGKVYPHDVIPHGIDVLSFKAAESIKKNSQVLRIAYTGGLVYNKGWKFVETAIYQIITKFNPSIEFYIYTGSEHVSESIIHEFPNVKFLKPYNPSEVSDILQPIDIVLIPTLFESYCLSIREAFAAKVVPICTSAFGIDDVAINNFNSLFISDPIETDLVNKIMLLYNDRSILEKLKNNIDARTYTDVTCEYDEIVELYKRLISNYKAIG